MNENSDWLADLLLATRGGHPEKCDFCNQPYDDTRFPEPEEAGAWTCTECVKRWRAEDHKAQATSLTTKEQNSV